MAGNRMAEYEVENATADVSLRVKGYGALRGTIAFRNDIDLTQPIFEQIADRTEVVDRKSNQEAAADD